MVSFLIFVCNSLILCVQYSTFEGERCGICMDVVIDRGVLDCCQHWYMPTFYFSLFLVAFHELGWMGFYFSHYYYFPFRWVGFGQTRLVAIPTHVIFILYI